MNNVLSAFLVALIAATCSLDTFCIAHTQICRPIIVGPLIGLVLGDIQTGLYIGASLEFLYLGVISVGAAIPPDCTTATAITTAVAILSGIDKEIAISLAVPVATVAQMMTMLAWTLNITWTHKADKCAEVGNIDGACRWHYMGIVIFFLMSFVPSFLAISIGAEFVSNLILPVWITNWLSLVANMMPAVGFAMLFLMMNKPKLTPFFMIGFVLAAALGMNMLTSAILGLAFALLYVNVSSGEKMPVKRRSREESI